MNRAISTEKVREYVERAEQARGTEAWRGFLLCLEHKRLNGRWAYMGWYVPFEKTTSSFRIKSFRNRWGLERFYLYDEPNGERYELRDDTDCLEFFLGKEEQA